MILGTRIEVLFGARHRLGDALIAMLQVPPCRIVVRGRDLSGEDAPTPAVEREGERQECDLVERDLQQHRRIAGGARQTVEQSDAAQVFRRDGQRDRVADRFVEAVIRTVLKEVGLLLIRALVEIVTQLVMHGDEVLTRHLQTRLDAHVVLAVDVPRTRVTDDLSIAWLGELRPLPERGRQRIESE